ncbi:glycosyltransferase [Labilibaculum sp. A4]|uniref:glycosyltransferase n=1 Tax=Labilibaculum euxinus TaxID=2686357 RepID=UPI000F627493|nr:glycosyltransferase [Labilibaculum euxinus]MDQ1771381.1 glycosyltransferase [Labilibaculum euxinus]MWN77169.1 glycosyltransferase [Labilibaculum euxinus]
METIITLPTSFNQWAILIVLLVAFCVQMLYQLRYIQLFKKEKKTNHNIKTEPVSIVICVKNEGCYLQENLSLFLEQEYPDFELILVNDGSEDETETIIKEFQKRYPHLRSTKIPLDDKFQHNKKLALSIGIKAAKNEKIIFTNIHSKPSSSKWLQEFVNSWDKGVHIGYANFENKKGFFYNFLKFDLLSKNIKSAGFASSGNAHSGNGDNLGYKKSDFFANKGFVKHSHFEAGYDHLMVFQLAKLSGASVCLQPEAKINLSSICAFDQWIRINRHYYKCRKYLPFKIRLLTDLEPISKMIFYSISIYALLFTHLYFFVAIIYLTKIILIGTLFKISTRHLKEENLFLSSYLYEIFVLFSKIYFLSTNFILSKSNQWK